MSDDEIVEFLVSSTEKELAEARTRLYRVLRAIAVVTFALWVVPLTWMIYGAAF